MEARKARNDRCKGWHSFLHWQPLPVIQSFADQPASRSTQVIQSLANPKTLQARIPRPS